MGAGKHIGGTSIPNASKMSQNLLFVMSLIVLAAHPHLSFFNRANLVYRTSVFDFPESSDWIFPS